MALIFIQHEGKTTILLPPNTAAFDLANRGASLLPARQKAKTPLPAAVDQNNQFAVFAQLMTAVVGAIAPKPSTPKRKHSFESSPFSSPVQPEYGDLHKYLVYAQEHLGVPSACEYEAALGHEDYGPDIIGSLAVSDLTEHGMSKGDAMRLIAGCASWKRNEKRRRLTMRSDQPAPRPAVRVPTPPQDDIVRYEINWEDGGSGTWFGPMMTPGDQTKDDRLTSYYNAQLKSLVPIPPGFHAPPRGEDDNAWPT
jgi:hypothetical protein